MQRVDLGRERGKITTIVDDVVSRATAGLPLRLRRHDAVDPLDGQAAALQAAVGVQDLAQLAPGVVGEARRAGSAVDGPGGDAGGWASVAAD